MGYSANAPLQQFFGQAPARAAAKDMADGTGDLLKERVTERTPIAKVPPSIGFTAFSGRRGRVPGSLKKSWEKHPVERKVAQNGSERFASEVDTQDPIAVLVEYPTNPHPIEPRADRAPASVVATGKARGTVKDGRAALMWFGPGGMVFARKVQHPGTQGVFMMRDALNDVDGAWETTVGGPIVEEWAKAQARLVAA